MCRPVSRRTQCVGEAFDGFISLFLSCFGDCRCDGWVAVAAHEIVAMKIQFAICLSIGVVAFVAQGCSRDLHSESLSQTSAASRPMSSPAFKTGASIAKQEPNTTISSFGKAKKRMREVYHDNRVTLYCGCPFDQEGVIDPKPCGYVPEKNYDRAMRLEWEHAVPAHAFGRSFDVWENGHRECVSQGGEPFRGRPCARKMEPEFAFMEADMYNLFPSVGELNDKRANYSMGMVPGEERRFGACDFEIADRRVEPRPEVRGDIARTYLYMDLAYPGHGIVSKSQRKMFERWDQRDPVDRWECERARRIAAIQKNVNQVVHAACQEKGL